MDLGKRFVPESSIPTIHSCSEILSPNESVKNLQNILFPITPRKSYSAESYLSNSYLKKQDSQEKLDSNYKVKDFFSKDVNILESVGQAARWPTECQVINERIRHIPFKPCPLEPYYVTSGREIEPRPIGEEAGLIVFQYNPISAVNYFCRSSIGGSKYLLPTCPCPEEESLRFESRFESGNLAKAIKITSNYYELYLRNDLYTSRHMQWFYFRITNMRKSYIYRFSIVNFTKGDNLYTQGMKPLMYSEKDAQMHSIGWRRCGTNIAYYSNENVNEDDPDAIQYYTLTFTLEFPHDDDTIYLAHSYPYTYTDLQEYLLDIVSHPVKSSYTTLRLLCKTLAGNNVYYVTVTTPPNECNNNKKKRAIVITARVHPGESPASWMMQGFLDYLTSDCAPAKELRDTFIFKLVPMLNPDGVIVGNNRCSLTGKDLNRQYRTVIRETYPAIWYTKLMIRRLVEECGVAMYCDLHAHSKKHNIFIFGCENRRAVDKKLFEQVFPLMLHKNASEKFSFGDCKFRIQKCKEGTGRVVMWMMGITNSFTMEASFGGTTLGNRSDTHFNTFDYEQMGRTFCQTLLDFYDEDPKKERLRTKILNRLVKGGSSADEPANINLSDYSSDSGDSSSASEFDNRPRKLLHQRGASKSHRIGNVIAPPPTPVKVKHSRIPKLHVNKLHLKNPSRRPLEVRKTNFEFILKSRKQRNNNYSSDSNSCDSETDMRKDKGKHTATATTTTTTTRKKKKKKRQLVKRKPLDLSDSDVQLGNDYTLLIDDIIADSKKLKNKLAYSKKEHVRSDSHRDNRQRLIDVQNKLLTLKNKLWCGVGDTDRNGGSPISWGHNNNNKNDISSFNNKKMEKRKSVKKPLKCKEEKDVSIIKAKPTTSDSIKRQTTIDFRPILKSAKLRKAKSLNESLKTKKTQNMKLVNVTNLEIKAPIDINSTNKKKHKKKIIKTAKHANK